MAILWLGNKWLRGTQNGAVVNRNMDQNLRSPGGLILTHTQISISV